MHSRRALTDRWPRVTHVTPATAPSSPPAPARHTGVFVAFEGGDGAGKSTQVRRLAAVLRRAGHEVLETRQPGGTPLGAALRELVLHGDHVAPRAEALIYAADKAHHVDTVIGPALVAGQVVLSDRYIDSAVAYQGGGRDLGAAEIADLQLWAVNHLVPDLTVVLDVTPQDGRSRRGDVHDRLEAEGDDFHQAVREQFLALAAAHPERYLVLDSTLAPEQIHIAVVDRLAATGLAVEATR